MLTINIFCAFQQTLIIIILFSLPSFLWSQGYLTVENLSAKHKKLYRSSLEDNKKGEFKKALTKLNTVIKNNPAFAEAYIKKASVLYNLREVNQAVSVLDIVIDKYPEYEIESYFTRGFMLLELKNFGLSARDFHVFLASDKPGEKRRNRANFYFELATFRDSLMKNPVLFTPRLLPEEINSKFSDYSPSLSLDGNTLVFTRRINNQEDLMLSEKDSLGNYSPAKPLSEINTPANEGAHCMSADGNLILFTGCDRDALFRGCDLYYSINKNGQWTKPANIGKSINTPAWESQPCLSADGRTLFFVSDRVGGIGGRDIWFSKKNERDVWTEPLNLGKEINTPQDDETPFLHPDGKTLYWRSNGRPGMGDFDIYTAKWDEEHQNWVDIKNLGFPINTEGSEGGLVVSLDGKNAYFATDDFSIKRGENPNLDICTFELPPFARANPTSFLKMIVYDSKTRYPLASNIEIKQLKTQHVVFSGKTSSSGNFIIPVHSNNKYAIHVVKQGYLYHSEHLNLDSVFSFDNPYILNIYLQPVPVIEKSSPVILKNLFFKTGSSEILPESSTEINNLFQLLSSNDDIQILIVGHTDNVGKAEENQILSLKRAQAVKIALVEKGITPDRILCEGKGEGQPIADNNSPEGRSINRRTEFVVIVSK